MHLLLLSLFLLLPGFPPFYLGFLSWFGLLPLLLYCQKVTPRQAWWGGLIFGFLFHLGIHHYLYTSFRFVLSAWFSLLVLAGMCFVLALYIGFFSLFVSYSYRKFPSALYLLSVPAAWVILEYVRSLGLLGHTGGFLGYTQIPNLFLLQPAAVYGIWGISFLMVLFQTLLLHWWQYKKGTALYRPIGATLFFLFFLAIGLLLPETFPVEKESENYKILLVQGNIAQEQVLTPSAAPASFQKYLQLTADAYQKYGEKLDLIVWPETVLSQNLLRQEPHALHKAAALSRELDTPLLTGAMFQDNGEVFNSILYFDKNGLSPKRYDKTKLVPFAEYFPFPDLLNSIARTNLSLGTYAPASMHQLFSLGGKPVAGVICFESYFGNYTRSFVARGARHLFILSNDAWFKQTAGVNQHADVAALRAVEMGLGTTQVANTGYTVSYNYRGEELLRSRLAEEEALLLETNLERRVTLYSLAGDYLVFLCLLYLASLLVWKLKNR